MHSYGLETLSLRSTCVEQLYKDMFLQLTVSVLTLIFPTSPIIVVIPGYGFNEAHNDVDNNN